MINFEKKEINEKAKEFKKVNKSPILVNKENFKESLVKFKKLLANDNTKEIYFDIIPSNLEKFRLNLKSFNDKNIYKELFEDLSKFDKCQIINTEFLILKNSNKNLIEKNYLFSIPTLKYHKFIEESFLNLNSNSIKFLNFNQSYKHQMNISKSDDNFAYETLSYLNFKEKEQMERNFEKILEYGKPPKNEGNKSYYYYPKNIIKLDSMTEKQIMKAIKLIRTTAENIDKQKDYSKEEVIERININDNFEVVSKLFQLNLSKLQIHSEKYKSEFSLKLSSAEVTLKKNTDNFKIFDDFKLFIDNIKNVLNEMNLKRSYDVFKIKVENIETKVIINWINFIKSISDSSLTCNLSNEKDLLEFRFLENADKFKFEFISKFLNNLLDSLQQTYLQETSKWIEKDLFLIKNFSDFDVSKLFPFKIAKTSEFKYTIDIIYKGKELKLDTFNFEEVEYDDLFSNIKNELDILFNFDLKSELYNLMIAIAERLSKISSNNDNYEKYNIANKDLFINYKRLHLTKQDRLYEIFENYIHFTFCKDKDFDFINIIFSSDKEGFDDFKAKFIKNYRDYQIKLQKLFIDYKKEAMLEEEFGLANFFEEIFKSEKCIIGIGLNIKLPIIYQQIFNLNPSDKDFYNFIKDLNLIDISYLIQIDKSLLTLLVDNTKIKGLSVVHKLNNMFNQFNNKSLEIKIKDKIFLGNDINSGKNERLILYDSSITREINTLDIKTYKFKIKKNKNLSKEIKQVCSNSEYMVI